VRVRVRKREIAENLHDGLKSQAADVSGDRELQINQLRGFFTFAQLHPLFLSTTSSLFLSALPACDVLIDLSNLSCLCALGYHTEPRWFFYD
jgi:hypothetical protein